MNFWLKNCKPAALFWLWIFFSFVLPSLCYSISAPVSDISVFMFSRQTVILQISPPWPHVSRANYQAPAQGILLSCWNEIGRNICRLEKDQGSSITLYYQRITERLFSTAHEHLDSKVCLTCMILQCDASLFRTALILPCHPSKCSDVRTSCVIQHLQSTKRI